DSPGDQWNITLQAGGLQTLRYLDVSDSDAANGLTLVGKQSVGLAQNNINWMFGSATLTWDGDTDSDWDTASNWDLGFVPAAEDSVIIANVTTQPDLVSVAATNVTINNLTVNAGSTLTLSGKHMHVDGIMSHAGTVFLQGAENVTIATEDTDSGRFTFGDADAIVETPEIPNIDYFDVTFSDPNGEDTYTTPGNLNIFGSIDLTEGTLDVSSNVDEITVGSTVTIGGGDLVSTNGSLDFNGDFVLTAGTFTAPITGRTFTLGGNFNHNSGGTFTHSMGTVVFDGSAQSFLGDRNNTFYVFTKTASVNDTLMFTTSATQTIVNDLNINGDSAAKPLVLRSNIAGTKFPITLLAGGLQDLRFLTVGDSDASGGLALLARVSTESPVSSTTNWFFNNVTLTWDGSVDTDWDTAGNWDLGLVPIVDDSAIIPTAMPNYPILATNIDLDDLTVASSATVTLNGLDMDVDDVFSLDGSIRLIGSETLTIANIDIDSGTFAYIGNGDGVSDVRSVTDLNTTAGSIDYYNIMFNDAAGALADIFRTNGDLVVANLVTITDGIFDINTNADALTVTATMAINGGVLSAAGSVVDANSDVLTTIGTLTAPSVGAFTVAGDWTLGAGATFTHSSGAITFDTSEAITVTGDTTFYNFESSAENKVINFADGSTQVIDTGGEINVTGVSSKNIVLKVAGGGTGWTFEIPDVNQDVQYVTVSDGAITTTSTNNFDLYCFSCTNGGSNDDGDAAATAQWIFSTLAIVAPIDARTVDRTPTLIGTADPSQAITIRAGSRFIGTTVADASGNWRFEVAAIDQLSIGNTVLRPYINGGALGGAITSIASVTAPTASQQPTITSHVTGDRVHGALPTFSGAGLANETIDLVAKDLYENLLLATVGTGTVSLASTFDVTVGTALKKGVNYVSVTVNGVASNILELLFTDPFGVVFDSLSNDTMTSAEVTIFTSAGTMAIPGTHIHPTDVNPVTTGADGFYSFLTVPGNYTITVSAAGFTYPSRETTFPAGREVVGGSKGELFTVASTIIEMDHPMDSTANLLRIEKTANKAEAKIGEIVTYTIEMENLNLVNTITDIFIRDRMAPGFKYMEDRVILDGIPIDDPTGRRPIIFTIGDFTPGQTRVLKYQMVIGSGVTFGKYDNVAHARHVGGSIVSNSSTATVEVVMDPLFDLGTILGKVFYDQNENGRQDPPVYDFLKGETIAEEPISNARIAMEDGTIITADANGLFSVPGIVPGRHLFRIDERSLPKESYLTTPKVVIVDVTQGSTYKVNFGVHVNYETFVGEDQKFFAKSIQFQQDAGRPTPRLNVNYFGDGPVTYSSVFQEPLEFRIFTNYASFVEKWRLEITEVLTNKVIKIFEGNGLTIFDPVYWDGKNQKKEYIDPEREYQYILSMFDNKHKFDETKAKKILFNIIEEEEDYKEYLEGKEKDTVRAGYKDWIIAENKINNLGIQTILIEGETIILDQRDEDLYSVQVMRNDKLVTEIPVVQHHGLTARELIESKDIHEAKAEPVDIILPHGDYDLIVQTAKDVEVATDTYKTITIDIDQVTQIKAIEEEVVYATAPHRQYKKQVRIGEDYLFFVGLGDAKIGYNFTKGNIEPIAQEDSLASGFYQDGKVAFYTQGKIKGKYLITSSFDSDRDRKELFRNLDPDEYYPVYGDQSTVDYEATDTQGALYALVEWDKSSAKWGNYSVGFDETEFGKYTRSLYGGKIDFESVSSTEFGDAKTKIMAFRARGQQKNSHNEFLATGGSLYYMRHKDIIEGSDVIKVEVRDKITGLVLSSREMVEGADYELDYKDGRVLFWKPLPTIVEKYSIISNELLDDNSVYLVADYEYQVRDKVDEATFGARVRQAVGDNVLVGLTTVTESQEEGEYKLSAVDVTVKPNKNTTITAEVARTESNEEGVFISTDGGLSFTEIGTEADNDGIAFGIKGDTRLFDKLAVKAGYRWVGQDFSSSATSAQKGKEITNIEAIYDHSDETRVTVRHDIQALIDDGSLQTQAQLGAQKTTTSLIQMVHEARKLKFTAEYQRIGVEEKIDKFNTLNNRATDTIAVQADYKLTDKVDIALRQQITLDGEDNDQTTISVVARPTDKITIKGEKTIGEDGFTGDLDVRVDTEGPVSFVGGYKLKRDRDGELIQDASGDAEAGVVLQLSDQLEVTTKVGIEGVFEDVPQRVVKLGAKRELEKGSVSSEVAVRDGAGARDTSITVRGESQLSDKNKIEAETTLENNRSNVKLKGIRELDENNKIEGEAILGNDGISESSAYAVRGISRVDDNTELTGEMRVDGEAENRRTSMSVAGKKKLDENTQTTTKMEVSETELNGQESSFTIGTTKKINKELKMASSRTFGQKDDGSTNNTSAYSLIRTKDGKQVEGRYATNEAVTKEGALSNENTYSLIKDGDGQRVEGKLTRKKSQDDKEISQSNIFGLSGDIGDKWALEGNMERSEVQNLDGTETDREVYGVAVGYVSKNELTGENLKASTKLEARMDRGDTDKRQLLAYQTIEGNVNRDLTLTAKAELSETRNTDSDQIEAEHKEFALGAAYRPVMHDRLQFLGQYTYQENKGSDGQLDDAGIEEERAHVMSAELIYDVTEKWQIADKFAYRIAEEKVIGFDFTTTHKWLMIQRLTYNIDKDWSVTGEARMLSVEEAQDIKTGGLFEVARNVGDYTQLGIGYNFTDFTDDLTELDYSTHGPYIRMTGKLYDRTPEELERSREQWVEEKVTRWAKALVYEELQGGKGSVIMALNENLKMAQHAHERGAYEVARVIYKDVVIAGEMMFEEAAQYIRDRIGLEEKLEQMKVLADQYYKNGQYEKSRKILEKVVEEASKFMIE
ncbi:MAG: putative repeat protein (TIGR01451 family), partial [Lysobacterales bacterium]